jgi:hypothetical protein
MQLETFTECHLNNGVQPFTVFNAEIWNIFFLIPIMAGNVPKQFLHSPVRGGGGTALPAVKELEQDATTHLAPKTEMPVEAKTTFSFVAHVIQDMTGTNPSAQVHLAWVHWISLGTIQGIFECQTRGGGLLFKQTMGTAWAVHSIHILKSTACFLSSIPFL